MYMRLASYPYLFWMVLTTIVPLFLIFFYSITISNEAGLSFTLSNYKLFFEPIYINVLLRSVHLALVSTTICLIIGYPVAMILTEKKVRIRNTLILLFIIPMWMNFLLRTYSWMTLLERNGLINRFLVFLGFPALDLMYNQYSVILGMVYNFLPFMILPIYAVLIKIDNSLIEAARDLGANRFIVFRKVIFPLSLPGVVSGAIMVFLPAVTNFVIPRLLGGGHFALMGNLIEQQFVYTGNWHFGSALSIILMVFILLSMAILARYDKNLKGGGLW